MDTTLVVRTSLARLLEAVRDRAGFEVTVRHADGYVAVEGLGATTCREIAERLDVAAAVIGIPDEGDEVDAVTRNPGSVWIDAQATAAAIIDDWTDGEPHRFRDCTPFAAAVLGSDLIGDPVEFTGSDVKTLKIGR